MLRVNLGYGVLLEVTNVLNSQRDSEGLWRALAEQISLVIPWERAGLTLYQPDLDAFRFYAVETNLVTPVLRRDTVLPRTGTAVGWVFEHRQPHIRPDLERERIFFEDEYYAQEGLGRMINLPLLLRDHCLGTLNLGSVQSGPPDPADLGLLQQVAVQIAFAIDNVRAYEEIDRLRRQLVRENEYLAEEVKLSHNFGAMLGASPAFARMRDLIQRVAPTDATVLVTGETGTGKELLARAIHEASPRRDKPFVRVNCAALPAGLIESELFGHERGAFTGADQRRIGRFELAHQGTLFLDEIGELPLEAQAKLLCVLQDGVVDRVGGTCPIPVDTRLIAATNVDLVNAIAQGRFRSDLFYRLHVFPITVQPLRDRPEDIVLLARHFMERYAGKFKRSCRDIDPDSLARLTQYSWPGNVRELQNVIERAMILSRSPILHIDAALLRPFGAAASTQPVTQLQDVERRHILQILEQTGWRISGQGGTAHRLGLHPNTLRSRMQKLGLTRPAVHRRAKPAPAGEDSSSAVVRPLRAS